MARLSHIDIPHRFQRNSEAVLAKGVENTGEVILHAGNELIGAPDLSLKDVLDVGCGVRFTQTIINRALPIKSYTGIDVNTDLIEFLSQNVSDSRFSFHSWNVQNAMYNAAGAKLTKKTRLPVSPKSRFDLIWMYSVITHNNPSDTECLFYILRNHIRKGGGMIFSALIDDTINSFDDRNRESPLSHAYYNRMYLKRILSDTGWRIESIRDKWNDGVTQNLFFCKPILKINRIWNNRLFVSLDREPELRATIEASRE